MLIVRDMLVDAGVRIDVAVLVGVGELRDRDVQPVSSTPNTIMGTTNRYRDQFSFILQLSTAFVICARLVIMSIEGRLSH